MSSREQSAPPPPFRFTANGALELRQGGGLAAIVGGLFLFAGVFIGLLAGGFVTLQSAPPDEWAKPSAWWMCAGFSLVGAAFVFGRSVLTFDLATQSLTRSYSMLIPLGSRQRSLSEFNAVVIRYQSGDSETPESYPIHLRAIQGKPFTICSRKKFGESRALAEFLSAFLRLPLADMTTDHEVLVAPDQVHASLQERLLSGSSGQANAGPPPALRSVVTELGGHAWIVIPRRRSAGPAAIAIAVSALILLLVFPGPWRKLMEPGTPAISRYLILGFFVFAFGIAPLTAVAIGFGAIRGRNVVTASTAGLTVERSGLKKSTTMTPAADILDLDYSTIDGVLGAARWSAGQSPAQGSSEGGFWWTLARKVSPTRGIIVKTRQGMVTFGEGLSAEELVYLRSVLLKALSGR